MCLPLALISSAATAELKKTVCNDNCNDIWQLYMYVVVFWGRGGGGWHRHDKFISA